MISREMFNIYPVRLELDCDELFDIPKISIRLNYRKAPIVNLISIFLNKLLFNNLQLLGFD